MHLTKALAALSAGALLLIGQSVVAQDAYTDRTQDRTAAEKEQDTHAEHDRMKDEEFFASTETRVETQDDEFSAQVETDSDNEFATEDQWSTETETSTETSTQFSSNSQVDDQKLETLAQIHLEMQDEIRDLSEELAVAASAEEAQEFQARMVDRQVQVIERHGWSRDEYNELVDQVNDNADLRSQFINMVVARDEQVAEFTVESDAEFQTDSEFQVRTETDSDSEFQVEADLDEDDDWMSDEETTASVEIEDEDDRVVAEDERDW